jgi:hypothetical protein
MSSAEDPGACKWAPKARADRAELGLPFAFIQPLYITTARNDGPLDYERCLRPYN